MAFTDNAVIFVKGSTPPTPQTGFSCDVIFGYMAQANVALDYDTTVEVVDVAKAIKENVALDYHTTVEVVDYE